MTVVSTGPLLALAALLMIAIVFAEWRLAQRPVMLVSTIAAVYLYSIGGPALSHSLGLGVYFGINIARIPQAVAMAVLWLSGLLVGVLLVRSRKPASQGLARHSRTKGDLADVSGAILLIVSVGLSILAIYHFMHRVDDKIEMIERASWYHYRLLLLWQCLFVVRFSLSRKMDAYLLISILCFCCYNLVFAERDFIFVLLAVIVIGFGRSLISSRLSWILMAVVVVAVIILSLGRASFSSQGLLRASLNQGSILFVDTYVLEYIGKSDAYLNGISYVHAIVSTITLGAVSLSETLARWLVVSYAGPNFKGGYGFSLDAEAYINFGILGVFIVAMALSVALSLAVRAFGGGSVVADFVVVWSMIFVVYGLRNESFNLVRSLFYCLITFLAVWVLAYAVARWRVFRSSKSQA